VKILVDETTADEDIERATALLQPNEPPAFLQPIMDQAGRPTISEARLTHLYRLARRHLTTIRVLPQTHKLLGMR